MSSEVVDHILVYANVYTSPESSREILLGQVSIDEKSISAEEEGDLPVVWSVNDLHSLLSQDFPFLYKSSDKTEHNDEDETGKEERRLSRHTIITDDWYISAMTKVMIRTLNLEQNFEIRKDADIYYIRKELKKKGNKKLVLAVASVDDWEDGKIDLVSFENNVSYSKLDTIRSNSGNLNGEVPDSVKTEPQISSERVDDDDDFLDPSTVGGPKLRSVLPKKRSELTMSLLDDVLNVYKVNRSSWYSHLGNQTTENLFDEIRNGRSNLFADSIGIIRLVSIVKVKIRHPKTGQLLYRKCKMMSGATTRRYAHQMLSCKCKKSESPFFAALRGIQTEIGYSVWGAVDGLSVMSTPRKIALQINAQEKAKGEEGNQLEWMPVSPAGFHIPNSKQKMAVKALLEIVLPVGFELPATEIRQSTSFPNLRTMYYINTLEVLWLSDDVPSTGSFTTIDAAQAGVVHLWQWEREKDISSPTPNEHGNSAAKRVSPKMNVIQDSNKGKNPDWVHPKSKLGINNKVIPETMPLTAEKGKALSFSNIFGSMSQITMSHQAHPTAIDETYSSIFTRFKRMFLRPIQSVDKVVTMGITGGRENLPHPKLISKTQLIKWLHQNGVPTDAWGKGMAKTVDNLLDEVKNGETTLISVKNSSSDAECQALRIIRVAKVEIRHKHDKNKILVETHQKLQDGRIRLRNIALSEKFLAHETPWNACERGIEEELLIPGTYLLDPNTGEKQPRKPLRKKRKSIKKPNPTLFRKQSHKPPTFNGSQQDKNVGNKHFFASSEKTNEPPLSRNFAQSSRQGKSGEIRLISMEAPVIEVEVSHSFPGLLTQYVLHKFHCEVTGLPEEKFCTEEKSKKKGMVAHYWDWQTREQMNDMMHSVLSKVQFYKDLIRQERRLSQSITGDNDYINVYSELLFSASKQNNVAAIECILEQSTVENAMKLLTYKDRQNVSALRIAALNSSEEAVETLIRFQLNLRQRLGVQTKRTSMLLCALSTRKQMHAIAERHHSIFDADTINQRDHFGCTMIYYAAVANRIDLLNEILKRKNMDINSACLHSCISYGATDALKLLLPLLRLKPSENKERKVFGSEEKCTPYGNLKMAPAAAASNVDYFKSLLHHCSNCVSTEEERAKKKRILKFSERSAPSVALRIVLQFCRPTDDYYVKYLEQFLEILVKYDNYKDESKVLKSFVTGSKFPLHTAIVTAYLLKTSYSFQRRSWASCRKHSEELESLVCDILSCCEDQTEAEQLLRERSDLPAWSSSTNSLDQMTFSEARKHETTCSFLSIKYELKTICSHKFFTTQNQDVWYGNKNDSLYRMGLGNSSVWIVQRLYRVTITFILMGLLTISLPILAFLPFLTSLRHFADIEKTEFGCCYFKWSSHSLSYIGFLITLAYVALQSEVDPDSPITPITNTTISTETNSGILSNESMNKASYIFKFGYMSLGIEDICLFVFIIANLVGSLEQIMMIGLRGFFQHGINLIDCASNSILLLAYMGRALIDLENTTYDLLMSIGALIAFFRVYHFFNESEELGPLWITMKYVLNDVFKFVVFLGVVIMAFCFSFIFLLRNQEVDGFADSSQTFFSLLWSIFEPFGKYDPDQSYQASIYRTLLFMFLLFAGVLLTNLLIAMMTDQYTLVQKTARIEWLFSLAELLDKYSKMPLVPPPFNLLVAPSNFLYTLMYGDGSLYGRTYASFTGDAIRGTGDKTLASFKKLKSPVNREMNMRGKLNHVIDASVPNVDEPPVDQNGIREDNPTGMAQREIDYRVHREEMKVVGYRAVRKKVVDRHTKKVSLEQQMQTQLESKLTKIEERLEKLNSVVSDLKFLGN